MALAELARSGERPVPIKELADRREIPEQFLEQLFSTLRRAGLLTDGRPAPPHSRPPSIIAAVVTAVIIVATRHTARATSESHMLVRIASLMFVTMLLAAAGMASNTVCQKV